MDISQISHDPRDLDLREFDSWKWRTKAVDWKGRETALFIPVIPNAGDWLHVGYGKHADGYGGKNVTLGEKTVRGPWHVSPKEVFEVTNGEVDLRQARQTRLEYVRRFEETLYGEPMFVVSHIERPMEVAKRVCELYSADRVNVRMRGTAQMHYEGSVEPEMDFGEITELEL